MSPVGSRFARFWNWVRFRKLIPFVDLTWRDKSIFVTGLGTAGWFGSNAGMDCRGREVLACLLKFGWAFSMWRLGHQIKNSA